jgi:hypothetical protein
VPKSALGTLTEIVATVESFGDGGIWLSRASPLIAKARLACLQDRLAVTCQTDPLPGTAAEQATVMRRCIQDLIERIDAVRALLALHGADADSSPEIVARLNALRGLLDTNNIARIVAPAEPVEAEAQPKQQETSS